MKDSSKNPKVSLGKKGEPKRCLILKVQKGTSVKREETAKELLKTLWKHGGVAQLGEHLPCKQGVDSSILFISIRHILGKICRKEKGLGRKEQRPMTLTQNGLIAQVVRAHA